MGGNQKRVRCLCKDSNWENLREGYIIRVTGRNGGEIGKKQNNKKKSPHDDNSTCKEEGTDCRAINGLLKKSMGPQ